MVASFPTPLPDTDHLEVYHQRLIIVKHFALSNETSNWQQCKQFTPQRRKWRATLTGKAMMAGPGPTRPSRVGAEWPSSIKGKTEHWIWQDGCLNSNLNLSYSRVILRAWDL